MSWFRRVMPALLFCVGAWLMTASAQQPAQPAKPAAPPPPPKADPDAKIILDDAIKALDRNNLTWIETILWQRMEVQGVLFQSEGIYLAGPERKLHMNLKVHLGESTGKLETICDGSTIWEITQLGSAEKRITKIDLVKVDEALQRAKVTPKVMDEYFQNYCFAGVMPLLQSMKENMTPTQRENVRWNGQDVVKLTAVWSAAQSKSILRSDKQPWPAFLPKQCRIYLDEKNRWPHRIEWWGPSPPRDGESLLLQMEFRNPKFAKMSDERCARVFKFDPGAADVLDHTERTIKELSARGQLRK